MSNENNKDYKNSKEKMIFMTWGTLGTSHREHGFYLNLETVEPR